MPELQDLHDAFADLERGAPAQLSRPPARRRVGQRRPTGAGPQRRRPAGRRPLLAVGLAAACVIAVAVAVAVPLALRGSRPAARPAAPLTGGGTSVPAAVAGFGAPLPAPAGTATPSLHLAFEVDSVDGWTAQPAAITRTFQSVEENAADGTTRATVVLFYGGTYDPPTSDGHGQVTVGGRPGYYVTTEVPGAAAPQLDYTSASLPGAPAPAEALVWEYAPGGWAVSVAWTGDNGRSDRNGRPIELTAAERARLHVTELALARSARPAGPSGAVQRVPFRLDRGSRLVVNDLEPGVNGGLGLNTPGDGANPITGAAGVWQLGWSPSGFTAADKSGTTTLSVAGRSWVVFRSGGRVSSIGLAATGFGLTITPVAGHASLSALRAVAARMTFATDLTDPASWPDADAALR